MTLSRNALINCVGILISVLLSLTLLVVISDVIYENGQSVKETNVPPITTEINRVENDDTGQRLVERMKTTLALNSQGDLTIPCEMILDMATRITGQQLPYEIYVYCQNWGN
jgi:hypothetical protein